MNADGGMEGGNVVPLRKKDAQPYASDVSFEIALDDAPDALPVPVDAPGSAALVPVDHPRPPLIPSHFKSLHGLRRSAAKALALAWYRFWWHALRSPRYLLEATMWAVVGLVRVIGMQVSWWWVAEMEGTRSHLAAKKDHEAYLKVHAEQKETRRKRGYALLGEAAGLLAGTEVMLHLHRWWPWAVAGAVALPFLARIGHPAGRRIITPAVVTPRFRRLNADVVLRAYYSAGLGSSSKPDMQITFGSPMARDGEGSRVVVDLPYGKGLKDAAEAKDKIASGLDVTESQVFISRDPTSYRRHVLWVADADPLAQPVGRTPLLACRQTDIWKPAPLGLDERGQLVRLLLMWTSMLIGSLPRQGKSFTARHLGLYAALDPFVRLSVFDAAGKPDWRRFDLVADSCSFGLTPTRDGLPAEILLAALLRIKDDVQDRYNRLSRMPTTICPEGKLTRRLARDPDYGMPVELLLLDEFQEYFTLGEISKDIADLLVYLTKVAPGAGVIVVDATQKPAGVGTGRVREQFNAARDNHAVRFSLRTASYTVSEAVLGQGAYGEGLDSSTLLPQYKGVGILRGASDASPTVRGYLADGNDAEKILRAARVLRERAGTLGGMAAGEDTGRQPRDVLGDVLSVFGGEPGLHWAAVAERLARRYADRWADVTPEAISAQCRDLGVPSVLVKVAGHTLRGCRRADLEQAVRS
jgi:hypothetical protein